MQRALQLFVRVGGIFIVGVAMTHITLGQTWLPDTIEVTASLDSEHRFYTALFLVFGVALIWTANDLTKRAMVLYTLLAALFIGGVARIVSVFVVGWPHETFIILGVLELVVPPAMWMLMERAFSRPARS